MMNFGFKADQNILDLIRIARDEDLGGDDVTSRLLIAKDQTGAGKLILKQDGVCCGLPMIDLICLAYDPGLKANLEPLEGQWVMAGTVLGKIEGPLRSLLSAERVILNFIQRMSGVATRTREFVKKIEGTNAKIVDTRKTIPGFRTLDKYAVRVGGGTNHRMGLYDGLLVKDNHIAGIPIHQLAKRLGEIAKQSRIESPTRFIEIEVDTLEQLSEVLKVWGVDVILLDNMDAPTLKKAAMMRDASGSKVQLEASGGVNMMTVREIAETGVDRISIGGLTHSVMALDISLDI